MLNELKTFLNKRKSLFWDVSIGDQEKLSQEAIVERILAFGNMTDVRELEVVIGKSAFKSCYQKVSTKKRVNLRAETVNYFNIYFKIDVS